MKLAGVKPGAVERVYTSDIMRRYGMRIWPLMFHELISSRELIWILAKRNLSVKYRQSILSYLWIVIPPVVAVIVFSYLASHRVINIGETPLPYLSYALLNMTIWLLFSNALISATKSLVEAGSLVTRVNFNKTALVIASMSDALLEFAIRLIAVAVVFYVQGVSVNWQIPFTLLLLVPLLLLSIGLGFLFSILNLVIRDAASFLGIALTLGMFLTPVLYPPPTLEPFATLNLLNPVSPVLSNIQGMISSGHFVQVKLLLIVTLLSCAVFMFGWRTFIVTLPRVNERA